MSSWNNFQPFYLKLKALGSECCSDKVNRVNLAPQKWLKDTFPTSSYSYLHFYRITNIFQTYWRAFAFLLFRNLVGGLMGVPVHVQVIFRLSFITNSSDSTSSSPHSLDFLHIIANQSESLSVFEFLLNKLLQPERWPLKWSREFLTPVIIRWVFFCPVFVYISI